MELAVLDPDLRALAQGEVIVAFVTPGLVASGITVTLSGAGPRPADELKPAYRRWADAGPPEGTWVATVESVADAAALDPDAGAARHILEWPGHGDLVVLRVSGASGPVLTDAAFAARKSSLEAALRS